MKEEEGLYSQAKKKSKDGRLSYDIFYAFQYWILTWIGLRT